MDSDSQSGIGSVSSTESDYSTVESKNVLQKQYSLIQQSYSEQLIQKKSNAYCCANEKTRRWWLRLIFLFVVALSLTISYFEVRFSTYSSKTVILNSGDQMLLPLSTYLNKQVKFYSNSVDLNNLKLYVLRNKPNISSEVVRYQSGGKFHMPSWTYQYWGFYLLKGSSMRISICADLQLQFYLIKGHKKLDKWTQQILYNGYDYHKNILPQSSCNKKSDFKTQLFTVSSSDTYYILFSSSAGWRFFTEVSVLLQFNRTYYNLSDLKYSCVLSNETCSAYLDEGSMDISLIETVPPSEKIHPFYDINLNYVPISRHLFYYKIYGGLYLTIFILTAIYIVWRTLVNITHPDTEWKPLLSSKLTQQYNVIKTDDNPWVVISKLSRISSKESMCEIDEKGNKSILGEEGDKSLTIDSISSKDFMQHNTNYMYTNEYNNSQQLLDICLTSAGASAI